MTQPYLSLVVTARNDDHGGNLLGRMQAFVNNWLNQSRRFDIPSELIIVEWNPPQDRPRLAQALRWPDAPGPCTVRIIEVPPEVHGRLGHAAALPLYQMIAKNVGIRRARGQFVLATNIDLIFSSELAAFLAEQRLAPDRMYRIDRHDAGSDVPVDADPEQQLDYCRTHVIRVNRREGTFGPEQLPGAKKETVAAEPEYAETRKEHAAAPKAAPDLPQGRPLEAPGVTLGEGWFPEERYGRQEPFRWAGERAHVVIDGPPSRSQTLVLEMEPGPGIDGDAEIEIVGPGGFAAPLRLAGRCLVFVRADWGAVKRLEFRTKKRVVASARDARPLAFRVIRMQWKRYAVGGPAAGSAKVGRLPVTRRAAIVLDGLQHLAGKLAYEGPLVRLTVFVTPSLQKLLRGWAAPPNGYEPATPEEPRRPAAVEAVYPELLHTNGCGDFTLLAREKWFDLRAYPEFDLFSMNLDSVFCFAAHYGGAREAVLEDPMRIYHIEHGTGSGWTPEGQAKLFQRIEALGLSYLDNDTVMGWAQQMRRFDSPMIFNGENWGFATDELPETVPVAGK